MCCPLLYKPHRILRQQTNAGSPELQGCVRRERTDESLFYSKEGSLRTCLVVPRRRIHLPMRGTRVQSQVGELSLHTSTTEPALCSHKTTANEAQGALEPLLQDGKHHREKPQLRTWKRPLFTIARENTCLQKQRHGAAKKLF